MLPTWYDMVGFRTWSVYVAKAEFRKPTTGKRSSSAGKADDPFTSKISPPGE
jgi:hypothetical protein